jgi:hypothetical protein
MSTWAEKGKLHLKPGGSPHQQLQWQQAGKKQQ